MLKTVHVVVGVTTLNGITAILAPVRCSRSPTPTWSRSLRPAVCTTPRQCTSGSKPGHCVLKTTQERWSVATDAAPAPLRLKAGALRAKVHPGVVVGGYRRCTSATPDPTPMHCGLKTALVLFLIDTLGRAQAARGLPLIGDHAYFCRTDGSTWMPEHAEGFKFQLQGHKTVKGTWSDWIVVGKARASRSTLTAAEHKRTCTIAVLAALVKKMGSVARQEQPQPYPDTTEQAAYGSSFFTYIDKTAKRQVRIMSCTKISRTVTGVMVDSGFLLNNKQGEASHVLRKHSTSAVLLLRMAHVPDARVHERAQHSATTWEQSY